MLTGPQMETRLDELAQQCDRYGDQFSLLCISLNNLYLVNDGYGHQQADRLIAEASRRLRQLCGEAAMRLATG